ncbi:Phosphoglycerate dehydrogenase [Paenibacillus sp. UNCCL117]|uniref:D-2-hydroxyacid dehydrogenase n=1 Tax=unclassified Paenibacillus TaxID=185978 RepID=UPI0008908F04|nr:MULTISPECIES: D-2-hydroxyacid dehydrogenase [unclassified Paenibacillus]SDC54166.1 Phosphoglycerate dehydrogenase [Paenibacillus sp. cl123]SFW11092.1 Phosphoglycerate dehydrogenase [Paenibacillus sp. UNCCL117]
MKLEKILLTGRLYAELGQRLAGSIDAELRCLPEAEVGETDLAWADAYVGFRPVPGFRADRFRWVHALGAGVDAYLHRRQWNPATILTRTTGEFGRKIAEYCLGYMLADAQHHESFRKDQAARQWRPKPAAALTGQSVVVFGTGAIGGTVAAVLRALGVTVWGVSLSGTPHAGFDGTSTLEQADSVLGRADWLINTLPLTERTEALFDERLFRKLKRGSALIHVGRGASLVEEALIRALDEGRVRKAVLDVFSAEPLPANSLLWDRREVWITPHIAAVTDAGEAAEELLATWRLLQQGETELPNRVRIERGY